MGISKNQLFAKLGYRPHPAQELYHSSTARFRVACCGRRFGKSLMAARDKESTLLAPNTRGWIVGPTYDLGEKEFRVLWDDLIIGQNFGQDKRIKHGYSVKQGNMYIELPWRARVEVRSADHPDSLVGEGLDWVIMSEAAKQNAAIWQKYLRPALADKRGTADFVSTPEGTSNFFHELWQQGQDPRFKDWESWRFPSWANTRVFPDGRDDPEIVDVENSTAPEWFLQEYAAEFTAFVGKIYQEFEYETHVETLEFNPDFPSYIGFDFGWTNPFAAIEFQITPNDEIRVWREHYMAGLTIDEHINVMQNRLQPPGYRLDVGFADAADPEAVDILSRRFVGTYALPEAKKNLRQGIDRVKGFLQKTDTGLVDGYGRPILRPKLVIDHSCKNLIREFSNYRSMAPPASGADPADKPFKRDDHGLDALRYGLVHLYDLGCGRHLEEVVTSNSYHSLFSPTQEAIYRGTEDPDTSPYVSSRTGGETIFNFSKEPIF